MLGRRSFLAAVAAAGASSCADGAAERQSESAPSSSPAAPPSAAAPSVARAAGDPTLVVRVDPRVELMSILCRLAGHREYSRATTPYAGAVDAFFAPMKEHVAVRDTADLRAKYGVGFDAPMTLAVYLDEELRPIRALSPAPPGFDARFEKVDVTAYLEHVRGFVEAGRFLELVAKQAGYAARVEDAMRAALAGKQVIAWFDACFGPKKGARYRVVPGLLTGPMAYGVLAVRPDGTEDIVQIMYLEAPDADGVPHPTEASLEYLVHELCHSYVNPIFSAAKAELGPVSEPLFESVKPTMTAQHYITAEIMVNESVVRAVTLLFLRDRSTAAHVAESLAKQGRLGFTWTAALTDALSGLRSANGGALPRAELVSVVKDVLAKGAAKKP
jgi:hypothetical protein